MTTKNETKRKSCNRPFFLKPELQPLSCKKDFHCVSVNLAIDSFSLSRNCNPCLVRRASTVSALILQIDSFSLSRNCNPCLVRRASTVSALLVQYEGQKGPYARTTTTRATRTSSKTIISRYICNNFAITPSRSAWKVCVNIP